MRIKHKETDLESNISLNQWVQDYLRKGIYEKWDIVNFNNVVKLYRIKEDGTTVKSIIDKKYAKNLVIEEPNIFKFEEGVSKQDYKDYLKIIFKNQNLSLKKNWYNLPNIKTKLETITKSKISKEFWFIIRGVIIIVIATIIIIALNIER